MFKLNYLYELKNKLENRKGENTLWEKLPRGKFLSSKSDKIKKKDTCHFC